MPITIPQSVFDKYYDVVDSTFNIFGVTCQLVYIEKVEVIDNTFNNIPDNRSVNPHRRPGGGNYRRNNKVIKEVEKTEDIKIKAGLMLVATLSTQKMVSKQFFMLPI